ncbi:unnamed protein product [Cunninghamella echinulata]
MNDDNMLASPQTATNGNDNEHSNIHIPPPMNNTLLNFEETGRMKKMDVLYKKFTDCILSTFSVEVLWDYFSVMDNTTINTVHSQSTSYLREQFNKIYDSMKKEHNLEERLNKLDEIIKDADTVEDPFLLPNTVPDPKQVVRAMKVKVKKQELERLWSMKEELHEDISTKMESIDKKKAKLTEYKNKDVNLSKLLLDHSN